MTPSVRGKILILLSGNYSEEPKALLGIAFQHTCFPLMGWGVGREGGYPCKCVKYDKFLNYYIFYFYIN